MSFESQRDPDQEKREKILSLIAKLHALKNDWSSEIPSEVIHGGRMVDGKLEPKFKVRKNWFQGVESSIYLLLKHGLSRDVYQQCADLCAEVAVSPLVTAEQISRADALIEQTIQIMTDKIND